MTDAPAQPPIPSDGTDELGLAVLQGLSRPVARKQTPRLIFSGIVGLASFGVIPVLRWGTRFRQFVTLEQQQLWHLAEWLKLNTGSADAVELREQANRLRTRPLLSLASFLCVVGGVAMVWQWLRTTEFTWDALLQGTYAFTYHRNAWGTANYAAWAGGLAVAYALHWLQVGLHAADRQRFVRLFDRASAGPGLTPIVPTPLGIGFRPLWLVAGIAITACGAPWGVPMMLAGAIHRDEITRSSLRDRQAMARRLHALLQKQCSDSVPMPVYLRRLCMNEFCRAKLPHESNYCPRCGARTSEPIHRVA